MDMVNVAWKHRSNTVFPPKGSKAREVAKNGTPEDFRHTLSRQQLVDVISEDACTAIDKASGIGNGRGITRVYALRRT